MMKAVNEMKLIIESRSVNEGFARAAVSAFAAQLDPTLDELSDIRTSVSEAVTNCIVHAYPESVGIIIITAQIFPKGLFRVKIRDRGRGIADVKQAMTPLFTTMGGERSGLGFSVMESFSDKLRVRSAPGRGCTVTLDRYINGRDGDDD